MPDPEPKLLNVMEEAEDFAGSSLPVPVMDAAPVNETGSLVNVGEASAGAEVVARAGAAAEPESPRRGSEARKTTVLEAHGYTVGETVGLGSYATVKVAKSENHDCDVAVKIVSKIQAPIEYLRKFLPREIEVVKGLRHPNVMRFLQAIETTHRVYIVMEYASEGSLLDVIRRESYIDEVRGRRWFGQLSDAVQYLHDLGIVHRDIKCENILMDGDLNVKLSDFGFARGLLSYRGQSVGQGQQLSDTFCGSYAYVSPEILREIPYQPQLADIWSMGVVLYAIVFGRLPFDDSNLTELVRQVQGKVRFPKCPKVSSACKSLIRRILAPARARIRLSVIRTDAWMVNAVPAPLPLSPSRIDTMGGLTDAVTVNTVLNTRGDKSHKDHIISNDQWKYNK